MKTTRSLFIALFFVFISVFTAAAQTPNASLQNVYTQCRALLLSDTAYANELSYRLTDDVKYNTDAVGYYKSLGADGSWKDIAYNRPDIPSAWPPSWHLYRIMLLCRQWHKNNDERYLTAIHKAMDFYLKNDFKCNNWWQNQINVPYCWASLLIMLDSAANADEKKYLEMLIPRAKQNNPTGQNKIWQHDIEARIALLQHNEAAFTLAIQNMQSVIAVSVGEGVQPDESFHQHGAMLQFGNYGLHFVNSLLFWIKLTAGTPYAFDAGKQQIIFNYCSNGLRWTVFKGSMDVLATGRQLRKDFAAKRGDNLNADFSLIRSSDPNPCNYYLDGMNPALNCTLAGNKAFWRSDYMVQLQSGQYMMSLKMHGSFVKKVESINGENLKGTLLNDGVALIQHSGNEYKNIEAIWQWNMLPGTTTDTTWQVTDDKVKASSNQSGFVGQVSDGINGAGAMYYDRLGLQASKSYFFINDMLVALGAGITAPDMKHVVTTINQQLYNNKTGKQIKGEGWAWHDGTAYFFPDHGNTMKWRIERRTKDWGETDKASAGTSMTDSVITWYFSQAHTDKYAYIIKPVARLVETHKMASRLPVKIISNTAQVQAVAYGTTIMAVFYKPAVLYLSASRRVQADAPCMLLIKGDDVYASDPSRKLTEANITIGKCSVHLNFPQGENSGSTVKAP